VSGGPFSRSISDPASTTLATGFCLFISVTPEYTNAEAKAFAAFLVAKDDFRRTASVMPQPLSPCASDITHPDTCPKKNLIELTKPRISSASLGSGMPDGLILISIFCPAKGRIASTNDFAALPKSFSLGPSKSNWFCSSLAAVSAREAASAASLAESFASPTSFERSKKSVSLPLRIHVSTVAIWDSFQNSPDTPTATNPAPKSPKANSTVLGLSGGCTIPRLKSCNSCKYSHTTKTTSSTTPTATKTVQNPNHQCSEELQSARLASALLSADSSALALHEGQEHLAKLQLIAIVIILAPRGTRSLPTRADCARRGDGGSAG
jgi:hypothetical protein